MMFILLTELKFCSPESLDFYTQKFPQFESQQNWWTKKGSFFSDQPTSPYSSQIFLAKNNQKILIVGTSELYLKEILANINRDIKDYIQITLLLIGEDITIQEYFQKFEDIGAFKFDLIVLPFVNCNTINKPEKPKVEKPELVLYDRTNKFYQADNWTQIRIERIQTSEQIQAIQEGYQKFNKQTLTSPISYFDFTLQKISGNTPLLLTSILDTTHSLQFNSITFCHISPETQMQSPTQNCQLAIPIGIQTQGIHGKGHIGNGFEFLIHYLTQMDTHYSDRAYLFALMKESIILYQQNLQQQYKATFGYTSYKHLQQIMSYYQSPISADPQDIIMRQNVKNGDILSLGQFRVFQIQFTIRGHEDIYEPLYKNNYKICLKDNGDEMLPFEGIYIYICQKIGNINIPQYIGRINQKYGLFAFIIQSSEYLNTQLSNEILIWYSYSSNVKTVTKDIQQGKMINTTLTMFLQIIGNTIPIYLHAISDIRHGILGVDYYFESNATIVYSLCIVQNEIVQTNIPFIIVEKDLITIQLSPGQTCNLYFCIKPYKKLNYLNKYCAKSMTYNIKLIKFQYYLITFVVLAIVWILFQQLLFKTILNINKRALKSLLI